MNERLNIRFLLTLLGAAAVVVVGWTAVHAFQVRRNADALRLHADRSEKAGQIDRATKLLGLYLEHDPDNVAARVRYGLLLDRLARSPQDRRRVLGVLEKVVEVDPERHDIRRKLVERALESGQFDLAVRHLDALRKAFPREAELAFQLGQCREARGDYSVAAGLYGEAVKLGPTNLAAALRLAYLLRNRLGKASDAEAVLDAMVLANKDDFHAYLMRARARQETGRLGEADADVAEALRLAPSEVDPRLMAADLAVRLNKQPQVARGHLQFVLDRRPDEPRVYEALAGVELRDGKPDAALACLRRGLAKIPDHANLRWNEANLLIAMGRLDEARAIVDKIPPGSLPFGRLEFLQAALKLHDNRWREAADTLEAIRPALAAEPDLAVQADLLLGQCLRNTGDDDRAVLVYRRVIDAEPTNTAARFGIVMSMLGQGRSDAALTECEQLMKMPAPPASGWPLLARLLILENLRQPAGRGRWEPVDAALDRADKSSSDKRLIVILRAESEVGRGRPEQARRILEAAREQTPGEVDYWIALVELADHARDRARADALLDQAAKRLGDGVDIRLARGRHCARAGDDASLRALVGLAQGADRFAPDERVRLLGGLGDLLSNAGRITEALTLWQQAASLQPLALGIRLAVFDLALKVADDALMNQTLDAIRQIEGPDGALSRYNRARQLLLAASKGDRARASEARALLVAVANKRQAWSRVPLAIARSYELEGSPDKAIEHFLKAIDLGERQLPVVRQVVEMLVERGRYIEADQVIRKLPAQAPVFANLQRLAAEVSLQASDSGRALDYALRAVPDDSKDAGDQRWLGQILWAAGQNERAERAFRRSVELAERDPAGWVALVQFYARTRQNTKAAEAITRAEAHIEPATASLALAQCYASVGKQDRARELFGAAVKARPDDAVVLQSAADFALRSGNREEAKAILRRIISLQVKDPIAAEQAQKLLAVVLAAGGDYQESREALTLIGVLKGGDDHRPATAASNDVEEQRTRAVVLATQPRKSQQQQAARILEGLERGRSLASEDQFLLAQLYDRIGDLPRSRDRMLRLLAREGDNPRYLAYQIRSLLRQGELNDARLWLEKLEQVLADAEITIELNARVLAARGQGAEAVELIRTRARADTAASALRVAALLEELGQFAPAEEFFRRYVEKADRSEGPLEFARFLARRKRLEEALAQCESVRDLAQPEAFGYTCLAVLRAARAGAAACGRVEGWLDQLVRKNPASAGLLVCQADLLDLRGCYPQAEALYRRVLERDPRNVVALNNLAWQLAWREGSASEALSFAEKALNVGGPQAALLDTRALALLANHNPAAALADLDDAALPTLDHATLASIRLHQARAYLLDGKRPEALKAMSEARAAGLQETDVHPLEAAAYRELAALR